MIPSPTDLSWRYSVPRSWSPPEVAYGVEPSSTSASSCASSLTRNAPLAAADTQGVSGTAGSLTPTSFADLIYVAPL